jgi:hypothetical protein
VTSWRLVLVRSVLEGGWTVRLVLPLHQGGATSYLSLVSCGR